MAGQAWGAQHNRVSAIHQQTIVAPEVDHIAARFPPAANMLRSLHGRSGKPVTDICPICKGSRFVCENHPRLAWPDECDCGAGDPCPVCNLGEPAMPEGFVRDDEAAKYALALTLDGR